MIGGNTQLDIGLPATVPIAAFIADVVALIDSRDPDPAETDDDAPLNPRYFTLARIGQEGIAPSRTLTEAQVYEGELLMLREVSAKEAPVLFDDVIDAVARLTAADLRSWSGSGARWTGLAVSVVAVLAALIVLSRMRFGGDGPLVPSLLAGFGAAAFIAGAVARRRYGDEGAAVWLALEGVLLLSGGVGLFVPDRLGGPHLLLAFSAAILTAVLGYRLLGAGAAMFATVVTVAVFGVTAVVAHLMWHAQVPRIGAGLLVGAITGISAVPRLAATLARIPVPPVPTAGAAIDPADHEPRPTIEGIGAIGATALPSAVGLGQRVKAANRFQAGILTGCTIAAIAGGLGAADPLDGRPHWPGIVLAAVAVPVLCLRGRMFAGLAQAATLVCGGCALAVGLAVGVALGNSSGQAAAGAGLLLFAVVAVACGLIGPHLELTPVTRRAGELLEYLLIISMVPLVLWVMDAYSTARNL